MGKDLRVCVRLIDRLRIIRPAGRHRGIARLLKHGGPALPATRQQPESMNKYDWRAAGGVGALNLRFDCVAGYVTCRGHASLLCLQGPTLHYFFRKASGSALIVPASVVGMPCGKPVRALAAAILLTRWPAIVCGKHRTQP